MLPKVIIHNSISLNGSLTDFNVNMPLHYQIASSFKADMHLVGSNTAKIGIDLFMEEIPKEKDDNYKKPDKEGVLWAIPDSTGKLKGLLHIFRQSDYCKDVVIFVSETTPNNYISYLKERNYDYHVIGQTKCDLKKALERLKEKYSAQTILTDTGAILSNLLLEQGLASQISLLVHPIIVGMKSSNMFCNINTSFQLDLVEQKFVDQSHIWLLFEIKN